MCLVICPQAFHLVNFPPCKQSVNEEFTSINILMLVCRLVPRPSEGSDVNL